MSLRNEDVKTIFNVIRKLLNPPVKRRKRVGFSIGSTNRKK